MSSLSTLSKLTFYHVVEVGEDIIMHYSTQITFL